MAGSTLCLQNTGAPGVLNIVGTGTDAPPTKAYSWMGRADAPRPQPAQFLRARQRHPPLPAPHRFQYPDEGQFKRPPAPRAADCFAAAAAHTYEAPDFVTRNQVDCIVGADALRRGLKKRMVPNLTGTFGDPAWEAAQARLDPRKHRARSEQAEALEEARKADIAAVLRGEDLGSAQRRSRVKAIKVLRSTLRRDEEDAAPAGPKPYMMTKERVPILMRAGAAAHAPRPVTTVSRTSVASSYYDDDDDYDDAASVASSTYMHQGRLVKRLPVEVRRQMIRGMKARWDAANQEYQRLTLSLFNLDTVSKVTRTEACEALMARLEKEIARISKGNVYCELPGQEGTAQPVSRPATTVL